MMASSGITSGIPSFSFEYSSLTLVHLMDPYDADTKNVTMAQSETKIHRNWHILGNLYNNSTAWQTNKINYPNLLSKMQ